MSSESSRSNPPLQTVLPINFIIVGGGLAGLSCAIALKRVGHNPVVLERNDRANVATDTGIRLPPNLTKIFFHWGLRRALFEKAMVTHTLLFTQYETGDFLGSHVWDHDIMKETRGLFMLTTHATLYGILYDAALAAGIEVRLGAEVEEIDPESPTVKLVSGEIITGDVLVGADGEFGLTRKFLAGEDAKGVRIGKALYEYVFVQRKNAMIGVLGDGHAIVSFPIHGGDDFAFQWYGPDDGPEGHYGGPADADVASIANPEQETLRMLMPTVKKAVRISIRKHEHLEDWVFADAQLALIGEAAHPFPPGTIQAIAMAIEDGAVLAKIFSHLLERRQIVSFLNAYQEIRQSRVHHVQDQEYGTMLMLLAGGEEAAQRNGMMKANTAAGRNVLEGEEGGGAGKQWEEMEEIFGYDCEDQADDWWMKWGMLRERSLSVDKPTPGTTLDFSKLAVQVITFNEA
ncbi:FAD/NAD-P-binding domain-containing protein [Trametes gibbosa]|nr:FAD/NAD-P-binding domain-containing protein [Trametes gibbosa]